MQLGQALYSILAKGRSSGERMLWKDERGQFGGLLLPLILGVLALLGISFIGAINFKFLLVLMMFIVIGLAVFGGVFKGINFKWVMAVAVVCLGITLVLTVTIPVVVGVVLIGFALWKYSSLKQPAIFVMMIGIGLLMVIFGTNFAIQTLGIQPTAIAGIFS